MSNGNFGLFPTGYHPSAKVAARRFAAALSPPAQILGPLGCKGLGSKIKFSKLTCSPWNVGFSSVHNVRNARRYSSVTRPRALKSGASIASNSSLIQPAPIPSMPRPLDITSKLEIIFAAKTAGRWGMTKIEVNRLIRSVTPARYPIKHRGSIYSPARPGNIPSSV